MVSPIFKMGSIRLEQAWKGQDSQLQLNPGSSGDEQRDFGQVPHTL